MGAGEWGLIWLLLRWEVFAVLVSLAAADLRSPETLRTTSLCLRLTGPGAFACSVAASRAETWLVSCAAAAASVGLWPQILQTSKGKEKK